MTPEPRRRSSERTREENLERLAAGREVGLAVRYVRVVRTTCAAGIGLLTVPLLLAVLLAPLGAFTIALGVLYGVSWVAFLRIEKEPLRWSVLLALLASSFEAVLVFLVGGVTNSVLVNLLLAWGAVVAVGLWTAVGLAARAQKVIGRMPDLWAARRLRGVRAEDEMTGVRSFHRERSREETAAVGRRLAVVGAVGVVAVAGLVFAASRLGGSSRPESPSAPPPPQTVAAPADQVVAAWNAARWDDLYPHFADDQRERYVRMFGRILDRHSWRQKPPHAEAPSIDERSGGHKAIVTMPFTGDDEVVSLKTYWEWNGKRWEIVNIAFKKAGD